MKKTFLILFVITLLFPLFAFADNGFINMDKVELVDVILNLPEDESLLVSSNREIVTREFNVGYDADNNRLVAVGYGKNKNMAIIDAYKGAIREIDFQLTSRMNRFVSGTLVDMTDYVRFYAVNRSRLVGLILEQSEDSIIEEFNGGVFVGRYTGTVDFDKAFSAMINAATNMMSVSDEVATEAGVMLSRLSGYYKSEDAKVFTFADGELVK